MLVKRSKKLLTSAEVADIVPGNYKPKSVTDRRGIFKVLTPRGRTRSRVLWDPDEVRTLAEQQQAERASA